MSSLQDLRDLYREALRKGSYWMLGTPFKSEFRGYNEGVLGRFQTLGISQKQMESSKYGDFLLQNASEDSRVMGALEIYARECNRAGEDLALKSRVLAHIGRLTDPERSDVEREFGLAFLETWRPFPTKDVPSKIWERLWRVIAAESTDTTMFWTFAPYLFASLKSGGMSEKEAIIKVLGWGAEAKGDPLATAITLKGLEKLPQTYVLSKNSDDATHKFTSIWAEEVVKLQFQ